jgi:nucleotide-binding universal stress UspA family protein
VSLFDRMVCGIDGTASSFAAVRQAAALADKDSHLLLLTVADEVAIAAATAGEAGMVVPPALSERGEESQTQALAIVRSVAPDLKAEHEVVEGPILPTMMSTLEERKATVVALGRHGHSRLGGIVVGSMTTKLLHDGPCSVLVCAERPDDEPFPRTVVVGFDGSEQAEGAVRVAADVAARTGASVEALCATGGNKLDTTALEPRLKELAPGMTLRVDDANPAHAFAEQKCDLIVVGHRGVHGLRASLGSVSERVAHGAECSVLVVR